MSSKSKEIRCEILEIEVLLRGLDVSSLDSRRKRLRSMGELAMKRFRSERRLVRNLLEEYVDDISVKRSREQKNG